MFFAEYYTPELEQILQTFPHLVKGVMIADIWRYCILYQFGGVYLDLDIEALKPISQWKHYPFDNTSLILGLEHNESFCNWALIASTKHPVLGETIRLSLETWKHDFLVQSENGTWEKSDYYK